MFQEFFSFFFLGCCWEGGVLNCGCWNAHGISLELKEITAAVAMSCWVFLNSSSSLPRVHLLYRSSRGRLLRNTQATHTCAKHTSSLVHSPTAPFSVFYFIWLRLALSEAVDWKQSFNLFELPLLLRTLKPLA
jgi:hypothetical protein